MSHLINYDPWPELRYESFKSTQYLLHRITQAMGKLKLIMPFDPHWAGVALWLTSQGLTTGPIPYENASYSIELDLIKHQILFTSSWGNHTNIQLASMSVSNFVVSFLSALQEMGIHASINLMPQEIPNPIAMDKDTEKRIYHPKLANAWLRILISSYRVMQRYHARFYGITPPIGLMWGTFDLRDARYKGIHVPTEDANAGYIRRNAMDDAQVEIGWWSGNEQYPNAAYFSFIYPEPIEVDNEKIQPEHAHWDKSLREFILDYEHIRTSSNPDGDLLAFFESTYEAEAKKAAWNEKLIVKAEPI